ncbi:MAG: hypothetical protein WKF40_09610, partial [Thermoleophilaceae bacterium]
MLREAPDEIEELAVDANGGEVHLPALLRQAFGVSGSEGRRLLAQGGVKLDGDLLGSGARPAGRAPRRSGYPAIR